MNGYEQIAADLGVPLFHTDLYLPPYKEGQIGRWRIGRLELGLDHGYHTGLWAVRDMPVLLRDREDSSAWETWMSLSPTRWKARKRAAVTLSASRLSWDWAWGGYRSMLPSTRR